MLIRIGDVGGGEVEDTEAVVDTKLGDGNITSVEAEGEQEPVRTSRYR